uniref:Uncharacterized protein n=1 Tax=Chromera velia CCMP2878 TaxID=1169474 RepID=A0A0G4HK03_9ALVE|eukprot:Cvel_7208.t1-p1 / transcript=Cvel_7208.t1 / gene=Cvel_7208 / organism=Chromera_velia_CCMP2878 / gene_product=hypothetical protein / transcript_product=hypothetical protein / location=Cvel_scaffold371:34644-37262(+) / protein_length=514 / sequence_SO=supercontig / SO=protein_coding / is_pseudo=false
MSCHQHEIIRDQSIPEGCDLTVPDDFSIHLRHIGEPPTTATGIFSLPQERPSTISSTFQNLRLPVDLRKAGGQPKEKEGKLSTPAAPRASQLTAKEHSAPMPPPTQGESPDRPKTERKRQEEGVAEKGTPKEGFRDTDIPAVAPRGGDHHQQRQAYLMFDSIGDPYAYSLPRVFVPETNYFDFEPEPYGGYTSFVPEDPQAHQFGASPNRTVPLTSLAAAQKQTPVSASIVVDHQSLASSLREKRVFEELQWKWGDPSEESQFLDTLSRIVGIAADTHEEYGSTGGWLMVLVEKGGKDRLDFTLVDEGATLEVLRHFRGLKVHSESFASITAAFCRKTIKDRDRWEREVIEDLCRSLECETEEGKTKLSALENQPTDGGFVCTFGGTVIAAAVIFNGSYPQHRLHGSDGKYYGSRHNAAFQVAENLGSLHMKGAVVVRSGAGKVHVILAGRAGHLQQAVFQISLQHPPRPRTLTQHSSILEAVVVNPNTIKKRDVKVDERSIQTRFCCTCVDCL